MSTIVGGIDINLLLEDLALTKITLNLNLRESLGVEKL